MWAAFKTRVKRFFCCYDNACISTDHESPPPYVIKPGDRTDGVALNELNIDISDSSIDHQGERFHNVAVLEVTSKDDVNNISDTEEPCRVNRWYSTDIFNSTYMLAICKDPSNRGALFAKSMTNTCEASESFITRDRVWYPSYKQTEESLDSRRHGGRAINFWSRHIAHTPVLFFANVNLDNIDIPFERRILGRRLQQTKLPVSNTFETPVVDTRDRAVRPKAAGSRRTRHCFTTDIGEPQEC